MNNIIDESALYEAVARMTRCVSDKSAPGGIEWAMQLVRHYEGAKPPNKERDIITSIMLGALRTIASGKKDYGEDVADIKECREIALYALERIGCI